jgi:hypothetical protein
MLESRRGTVHIVYSKPTFFYTAKVHFLHIISVLPYPEWNLKIIIIGQLLCCGCAHSELIIRDIFINFRLPLNQAKYFFIILARLKIIEKSLECQAEIVALSTLCHYLPEFIDAFFYS